ncbi:hypothetical protein FRC14_007963 [Serendipita sp. 396]|nr:hypothetical protein FRC14_007963 [Serendipita sp. 396]
MPGYTIEKTGVRIDPDHMPDDIGVFIAQVESFLSLDSHQLAYATHSDNGKTGIHHLQALGRKRSTSLSAPTYSYLSGIKMPFFCGPGRALWKSWRISCLNQVIRVTME